MANGGLLGALPTPIRKGLVKIVNGSGPLRRFVSKKTINRYAYAVPPRPRPVSMAADYVTWQGLTDRRYSGRHLPVPKQGAAPGEPDIEELLNLFRRKTFRPSNDTSLLFPFFAQWFVDSFLRTKWEDPSKPRKFQENESNHEIDLCSIYGATEVQTRILRESGGRKGRLRMQVIDGQDYPANLFAEADGKLDLAPEYAQLYTPANFQRVYFDARKPWNDDQKRHAFAVGLEHGSATLGNSLMNTLFMREHNRVADIIAGAHSDWDDERVFQTARNVTLVELLNVVIGDYIVHIAPIDIKLEAVPGMAEGERWYRTNWMAVEFALLYRWHDLIPDTFEVTGKDGVTKQQRPGTDMLRANALLKEVGLDQLLLDASRQYAGRIGLGNTADFLVDVKRVSIEMARGCRLPGFNAYREYCGLKRVTSFEELTGDRELAGKLSALYGGDIDRLEWFVGLFAEGYDESSMMGELLVTMVANDAFTQALTNPLLAKSVYCVDTFSHEGLEIIKAHTTLADIVAANTDIRGKGEVGFAVHEAPAASAKSG